MEPNDRPDAPSVSAEPAQPDPSARAEASSFHDDHAESLVALARIRTTETSLESTLSQVLQLACASMEHGDLGGVTLLGREGPETAVATDEEARRVDALQYEPDGGGPCLEAYRQQRTFRIDSTAADKRWPIFTAGAAEAGIRSTLSLPLIVDGDGLGAINVYSRSEHAFSEMDEKVGLTFAAHAAVALANSRTYWRTQRLAQQLEDALRTRGVIEQAKGMLMAEQGITADEAFAVLVRGSQRRHIKLHELASELVERSVERAKQRSERRSAPPPPH